MPLHYKDRPKQLWMCRTQRTILRVFNFMNEVPKWRAQYLASRSVAWQQETPSLAKPGALFGPEINLIIKNKSAGPGVVSCCWLVNGLVGYKIWGYERNRVRFINVVPYLINGYGYETPGSVAQKHELIQAPIINGPVKLLLFKWKTEV